MVVLLSAYIPNISGFVVNHVVHPDCFQVMNNINICLQKSPKRLGVIYSVNNFITQLILNIFNK